MCAWIHVHGDVRGCVCERSPATMCFGSQRMSEGAWMGCWWERWKLPEDAVRWVCHYPTGPLSGPGIVHNTHGHLILSCEPLGYHSSLCLVWARDVGYHTVMEEVRTLSKVALQAVCVNIQLLFTCTFIRSLRLSFYSFAFTSVWSKELVQPWWSLLLTHCIWGHFLGFGCSLLHNNGQYGSCVVLNSARISQKISSVGRYSSEITVCVSFRFSNANEEENLPQPVREPFLSVCCSPTWTMCCSFNKV